MHLTEQDSEQTVSERDMPASASRRGVALVASGRASAPPCAAPSEYDLEKEAWGVALELEAAQADAAG